MQLQPGACQVKHGCTQVARPTGTHIQQAKPDLNGATLVLAFLAFKIASPHLRDRPDRGPELASISAGV